MHLCFNQQMDIVVGDVMEVQHEMRNQEQGDQNDNQGNQENREDQHDDEGQLNNPMFVSTTQQDYCGWRCSTLLHSYCTGTYTALLR